MSATRSEIVVIRSRCWTISHRARGKTFRRIQKFFEGNILDLSFLNKALSVGWGRCGSSCGLQGGRRVNGSSGQIRRQQHLRDSQSPERRSQYRYTSDCFFFVGRHFRRTSAFTDSMKTIRRILRISMDTQSLKSRNLLAWYDKLKALKYASLRYFNAAGYDLEGRVGIPEKNPQNLLPGYHGSCCRRSPENYNQRRRLRHSRRHLCPGLRSRERSGGRSRFGYGLHH